MDKHIQRFRRSKKDAATPIILSAPSTSHNSNTSSMSAPNNSTNTASTPPHSDSSSPKPPGTPPSNNNLSLPPASTKPRRKLSPFRNFHLRPMSHKRARDSPPSSIPHSPVTTTSPALEQQQQQRPRTAHAHTPASGETRRKDVGLDGAGDGKSDGRRVVRMPRFLELSDKEILEKFSDLVWQERNRLALSSTNASPSYRWARVSGPHLRLLDRYVNIQPWQNNRVRLKVPEGEVDYINASPIVLHPTRQRSRQDGKKEVVVDGGGGGGEEEVHRYIAMQGPKQSSQDHVWRMVVEQLESPGVIVMLTETHEAGQEKCWQYFPREIGETVEINPGDEFGDGFSATVTCEALEDTPAGEAIELRRMVVRVRKGRIGGGNKDGEGEHSQRAATPEERQAMDVPRPSEEELDKLRSPTADIREGINMLGGFGKSQQTTATEAGFDAIPPPQDGDTVEERVVYHFLYKKWPDFGVPALADLESFFTLMRLSREKNASPGNPRIVHCSAGVGRSGTFIALEHLMRELDAGLLEDWDADADAGRANNAEVDGEVLPDAANGHSAEAAGDGCEDGQETMDDREESGVDINEADDLIFNTVNVLREQRRTMVQADAQYLFIYQVLRKLWLEKYGFAASSGASGREGSGEPAAKRLEVDPFVG